MSYLKKLNLGLTLWTAFGLLLVLSIGQAMIVAARVASAENSGREAVAGIDQLSDELGQVRTSAEEASANVTAVAGRVQTDLVESMKAGQANMQILQRNVENVVEATSSIVAELEGLLDSADLDDDTAGAIEDLLFSAEDSADAVRKEALPLVREGVERMAVTAEKSKEIGREVGGFSTTMQGFAQASASATEQATAASSKISSSTELIEGARWFTMSGAVVVLVVGVGVPLLVVPRINAEVRRTTQAMEAVAHGDLTQQIQPQAFSEFDRIASAVNRAVGSMAHAVQTIRGGATRLTTSSRSLSDTSESLGDSVDRTTVLSNGVAAAAEEMSVSMREIASSVERVSDNNTEIASAAGQMIETLTEVNNSVGRATAVTANAAQLAESGGEQIRRLGEAAGEISEVSSVIQDIAEMTNLLALNATIEAARAGESGKGFAVVATEVKELARQTSQATESIRQKIESIQSASTAAVDLVSEINKVIREVSDESSQIAESVSGQHETTEQIAQQIQQAAAAAEVVSTNVGQTAAASQEIAQSIGEVNQAASTTASAAEVTRDSGHSMTALAGELNEALEVFNIPAG